jgi:GAF domain-containing protein
VATAPLPPNEGARLAALLSCKILDTELEPAFDAVTDLAAFICNTPIALVSLVDTDRQWFKSAKGMDGVRETPRGVSFCAHAIGLPEAMEVEDATLDPRFSDNDLVTGLFGLRFYCGVPLVTRRDGLPLGTICVIDRFPRKLNIEQHWALRQLAAATTELIEMRSLPGFAEREASLLR